MDGLQRLNGLPGEKAEAELLRCCGSVRWAQSVAGLRPFRDAEALFKAAEETWWRLAKEDWLEAFSHHPRIGGKDALRAKFASTRKWAAGEQAAVAAASEETLERLETGNREYEKRFGHIFIVCATGKSAKEMLFFLMDRLGNEPEKEIKTAAGEQAKITRLRLEKFLNS